MARLSWCPHPRSGKFDAPLYDISDMVALTKGAAEPQMSRDLCTNDPEE